MHYLSMTSVRLRRRLPMHNLTTTLNHNGIVLLPPLLSPEQLESMRRAFTARLMRMSWNDVSGYEQTEMFRQMVSDILVLDQGFLDIAIHPLVKQILTEYLGDYF